MLAAVYSYYLNTTENCFTGQSKVLIKYYQSFHAYVAKALVRNSLRWKTDSVTEKKEFTTSLNSLVWLVSKLTRLSFFFSEADISHSSNFQTQSEAYAPKKLGDLVPPQSGATFRSSFFLRWLAFFSLAQWKRAQQH